MMWTSRSFVFQILAAFALSFSTYAVEENKTEVPAAPIPKEVMDALKKNGWEKIRGQITVKDKEYHVDRLILQADKATGAIALTVKHPPSGSHLRMLVCYDPSRDSRSLVSADTGAVRLTAEKGYGIVVSDGQIKVYSPEISKIPGGVDNVSWNRFNLDLKPENTLLPLTLIFDGEKIQNLLGDKTLRIDKNKTTPGSFLVEMKDVVLTDLPKCTGK